MLSFEQAGRLLCRTGRAVEDWDAQTWEAELQATLSHELTHHMENRSGLYALDDRDAAEYSAWRAEYRPDQMEKDRGAEGRGGRK